jgi:EAL domain-containing protein (putative c-di-GMP-specific phosphodiesterase class I)
MLLRNADVAMYTVKQSGRGRYEFYAAGMLISVVNRVEMAQQLRYAVDRGELVLHYQPILSLHTGLIVGVEALIRWQHPERGLLQPGEFIEVAEETGSIVSIGRWVLDTACAQARAWQIAFPAHPLKMSVNLSPVQVLQANIVDAVASALARSGLPPADLVLELTEAVMVKDMDLAATRLGQLKVLGVHLAIDDFGTGYSSLSYLTDLPFDVLKIDKHFIDRVSSGGQGSDVARAVIGLAASFELQTLAEGVERLEQAEALHHLGCDFVQGYLFAKPVPADQLPCLLAGDTPRHPMGAPFGVSDPLVLL